MNPERGEPAVLEALIRQVRTWVYPLTGILFGIAAGILMGHQLSMLAHDFHNSIETSANSHFVILSEAKDLAFPCSYEILRYAQNDILEEHAALQ